MRQKGYNGSIQYTTDVEALHC